MRKRPAGDPLSEWNAQGAYGCRPNAGAGDHVQLVGFGSGHKKSNTCRWDYLMDVPQEDIGRCLSRAGEREFAAQFIELALFGGRRRYNVELFSRGV
jgi:hypothetical protein